MKNVEKKCKRLLILKIYFYINDKKKLHLSNYYILNQNLKK